MERSWVGDLIRRWRSDDAGTYRMWFLWDARIKNFRSIGRGVQQVTAEIKADTFGNHTAALRSKRCWFRSSSSGKSSTEPTTLSCGSRSSSKIFHKIAYANQWLRREKRPGSSCSTTPPKKACPEGVQVP